MTRRPRRYLNRVSFSVGTSENAKSLAGRSPDQTVLHQHAGKLTRGNLILNKQNDIYIVFLDEIPDEGIRQRRSVDIPKKELSHGHPACDCLTTVSKSENYFKDTFLGPSRSLPCCDSGSPRET